MAAAEVQKKGENRNMYKAEPTELTDRKDVCLRELPFHTVWFAGLYDKGKKKKNI